MRLQNNTLFLRLHNISIFQVWCLPLFIYAYANDIILKITEHKLFVRFFSPYFKNFDRHLFKKELIDVCMLENMRRKNNDLHLKKLTAKFRIIDRKIIDLIPFTLNNN